MLLCYSRMSTTGLLQRHALLCEPKGVADRQVVVHTILGRMSTAVNIITSLLALAQFPSTTRPTRGAPN
jgi:hypothetical protein